LKTLARLAAVFDPSIELLSCNTTLLWHTSATFFQLPWLSQAGGIEATALNRIRINYLSKQL